MNSPQMSMPDGMPDPIEWDRQRALDEEATRMMTARVGVTCPVHPMIGSARAACAHCLQQDEVHPDGIVFTDAGYYVCFTCFKHIEQRKVRLRNIVRIYCNFCLEAEINRILTLKKTLFRDLSQE